MDGYFESVVETLTGAGYRWYETANFCRAPSAADGRDLRARHNLAYWEGRDYLGLGIGAFSTVARSALAQHAASSRRTATALAAGRAPARELEPLDAETLRRERVMLGLRLDEPLRLDGLESALDRAALDRLAATRPGPRAATGRSP